MAFSIAGLIAQGETEILHPDCVGISYPGFFDTLKDLTKE
jgi:3-phosphoshikimate 1-carboxyvinyltransferase